MTGTSTNGVVACASSRLTTAARPRERLPAQPNTRSGSSSRSTARIVCAGCPTRRRVPALRVTASSGARAPRTTPRCHSSRDPRTPERAARRRRATARGPHLMSASRRAIAEVHRCSDARRRPVQAAATVDCRRGRARQAARRSPALGRFLTSRATWPAAVRSAESAGRRSRFRERRRRRRRLDGSCGTDRLRGSRVDSRCSRRCPGGHTGAVL